MPEAPTLEGGIYAAQVMLSWTNPGPVGCLTGSFLVEAGSAPGLVDIASIPIEGTFSASFPGVPFGTYYVRVRQVRNGVVGLPSNELRLDLACASPPAIVNPGATAVGNAARFTWQYASEPISEFAVFVEAGSSLGARNLGAIPAARLANGGFNAAGPAGTHFTRIRAVNACGTTVSEDVAVTLDTSCPAPGFVPFVDAGWGSGLVVSWDAPTSGGLVMSYRVEAGSTPGASDLASRIVEGRWTATPGFSVSLGNFGVPTAYVRVIPLNSCGRGLRSAEAQARKSCTAPPPSAGHVSVVGRRVDLQWSSISEFDPIQKFVVEIGRSPFSSDVLKTPTLTAVFPSSPSYSVELPPGRYFARARRIYDTCGASNPSRELSFVIEP